MSWLIRKYLLQLSNRLDVWSERNGAFNFRCPYCGDSKKDKFKARGYLYSKDTSMLYHCHNCGVSKSGEKFLQDQDNELYKEYKLEELKEKGTSNTVQEAVEFKTSPTFSKSLGSKPFKELKKVSSLPLRHPGIVYIKNRMIPSQFHYKIFYVDNGYTWASKWLPDKFNKGIKKSDPRIVLPLYDNNGKAYGAIARSIDPHSSQRYLKLNWADGDSFIYGLDTVDVTKTVYVMEGQFDSLFIPNSVAVGSLHWGQLFKHIDTKDFVIVLDNEPRNDTTKQSLSKAIDAGYKVCVWPSFIKQKDINDMVINGMKPADIKQIIDTNTYQGPKAKLAMSVWSR